MTRFGMVSHDYYPPVGGQAVYVQEILKHLGTTTDGELRAVVVSPSEKGTVVITSKTPFDFSLKFTLGVNALVRNNTLSLLHVQGGPGGVLLLKRPAVPVIYTAHHSYCLKYRYMGHKVSRIMMVFERMAYKNASKIIVPSQALLESLNKDYGIDKKLLQYIPEGYDPELFYPLHVRKIPRSVLFVGRLSGIKGVDRLILAVKELAAELPIKLYLLGEGEDQQALRELVRREGLDDRVVFLGRLDQHAINEWYNKASVTILPSYFESFGLVCLESAAAGTPVIVTKSCGAAEIVKRKKLGIVMPSNSVAAIARALRSYFSQKPMRIRAEQIKEFTWEEIARKTAAVYTAQLRGNARE